MKTRTEMLRVVEAYGRVMRSLGVQNPVFLMSRECAMTIMNPDGEEFDTDLWVPCHQLPDNLRRLPGTYGMYTGVLLVEALNYNMPINDVIPVEPLMNWADRVLGSTVAHQSLLLFISGSRCRLPHPGGPQWEEPTAVESSEATRRVGNGETAPPIDLAMKPLLGPQRYSFAVVELRACGEIGVMCASDTGKWVKWEDVKRYVEPGG